VSNTTIPMLPAVIGLTGTEQIEVVQNGASARASLTQVATLVETGAQGPPGPAGPAGPAGNTSLGQTSLSIRATFSAAVANAPMIANYQFGSGVAPGSGITPITNQTQLAANFNAFEDFTGMSTINSEIQRYQSFNSSNHQFLTDRLQLNALNPNSDWNCQMSQISGTVNLNNTSTAIANLGLANTTGLQVGQMVCVARAGTYIISAFVVNTSVTLQSVGGSPTTSVSTGVAYFMPIVSAVLSAAYVPGNTFFTVTALPAITNINGMQLAHYNTGSNTVLERNNDYRVTTASGTTVNFNTQWTVGALGIGELIWFLPVVTSGQIWSQLQIDITNPQTFFALECHVDNYGGSRSSNTLNANSLAQVNALPANTPWGAWATFWCYSADDGNSTGETGSASEIDVLEPQISVSQGCQQANTGNNSGTVVMIKSDSGWINFYENFIHGKTDGSDFTGDHLWQLIFCNGYTYKFFDGILIQVQTFIWNSQHPLQFGFDLAAGAVPAAYGANVLFPNATTNFAGIISGIKGIKVWYQAAVGGG
jgi:hypothetical protein